MIRVSVVVLLFLMLTGCALRPSGDSYRGPLPKLTPEQLELRARLESHVRHLSDTIGIRNIDSMGIDASDGSIYLTKSTDKLDEAAAWIESELTAMGAQHRRQSYEADGFEFHNIIVELEGSIRPNEVLVIGAHYDSDAHTPGADDNATAVAALLEIVRFWTDRSAPQRTLQLVFYTNEEMPYFKTEGMGSVIHARSLKRNEDVKVMGMLSLEMLGYYSEEPDSQSLPWAVSWLYPRTGDFVAFVCNRSSRRFMQESIDAFRASVFFPSEGLSVPAWLVPHIGLSDQWSYWQEGYPAVMVTDTAFMRNPHYHELTDTAETIDYRRLTLVTQGLLGASQVLSHESFGD